MWLSEEKYRDLVNRIKSLENRIIEIERDKIAYFSGKKVLNPFSNIFEPELLYFTNREILTAILTHLELKPTKVVTPEKFEIKLESTVKVKK